MVSVHGDLCHCLWRHQLLRKPAACEDRFQSSPVIDGKLQFKHVPVAKKDVNRKNVTKCRTAEEQKYGNKVRMIA